MFFHRVSAISISRTTTLRSRAGSNKNPIPSLTSILSNSAMPPPCLCGPHRLFFHGRESTSVGGLVTATLPLLRYPLVLAPPGGAMPAPHSERQPLAAARAATLDPS